MLHNIIIITGHSLENNENQSDITDHITHWKWTWDSVILAAITVIYGKFWVGSLISGPTQNIFVLDVFRQHAASIYGFFKNNLCVRSLGYIVGASSPLPVKISVSVRWVTLWVRPPLLPHSKFYLRQRPYLARAYTTLVVLVITPYTINCV